MASIYLDNASTTYPKPEAVAEAVGRFLTEGGANVGRGGYRKAYAAEELVFEARERLCRLFGAEDAKCAVFTKNVTESLNTLLKGFLRPGDHVLVSSVEHNAMMRPLVQLEQAGVSFSRVPCRADGSLDFDALPALLRPNTRLVAMTHASNVAGTVLPLEEVGRFCEAHALTFFIDSAQSAGVLDLDMKALHADAIAFTGHKGLLGPQGIGGFVVKSSLAEKLTPLISGGTGSLSHLETVPAFLPDRFEAGTMNLPGIAGLHAALGYLEEVGIPTLRRHERALTERFLAGLTALEEGGKVRIVGPRSAAQRVGVVSLVTPRREMAEVAEELDERFGIMTRVGLHCAPNAHKVLGTFPTGTIRFSFGFANTAAEVDAALEALESLC